MKNQIANYISAGYPGLYLVSHEEQRVELEMKAVAKQIGFTLYEWSVTEGIIKPHDRADKVEAIKDTQDPIAALNAFVGMDEKSILLLRDFHMFLADPSPMLFRTVRDMLAIGKNSNRVLVIIGCQLKLPPELEKEITVIEYKLPDREQLKEVLVNVAESAKLKLNGETEKILDAAGGLTTTEAENAFALSFVEVKDIVPHIVAREKANTVKKNGLLEIVETKIGLDSIGGLDVLKGWLSTRRHAFSDEAREYGLPVPKGILTLGLAGTGKSLTAKATANILGVPLLKLDAGRIFGSLVGESERNMRAVIQTAEAIAPCVLWIDEIEKGMGGSKSSGSTDGGTTARVFGSFLQWMQEKTAPVFVVATANDVSQLPPELLRKGRFDEQWFVDLPNEAERADIWRIQIERLGRKAKAFKLDELAAATNGWTGAEIEALFKEALFAAFDAGKEPDTKLLIELSKVTVPLSQMMKQQVGALRSWCEGRARRASSLETKTGGGTRKIATAK